MARTKAERIADIEMQMEQLENQRKKLIQQQKEQARKERTKRLCRRMGLFESLLPDTIPLTDEQFKDFLSKTILSDPARHALTALLAQNVGVAASPDSKETLPNESDEGKHDGRYTDADEADSPLRNGGARVVRPL